MTVQKREAGGSAALTAVLLTAAGCLLYMVSGGIRCNVGIMVNTLAAHVGIGYAEVSFAVAVGQLMYGVAQPFFGMLALKRSNAFVLLVGVLMMASGLLLATAAGSGFALLIAIGLLLFGGTGAVCFGIIMGAISPILGERRASAVSGILNASSGIGTSLLSPLIRGLQDSLGIARTLLILCVPVLVMIPVVLWIGRAARRRVTAEEAARAETPAISPLRRLREAVKDPNYRRLMAGFGTCGFHMSIIQAHVYSQIVSYGIREQTAALAYTVFGITSMVGSVLCGLMCQRLPHKNVLGSLYGIRALIVAAFLLLMPKTAPFVFIFIIVLGMTGDATVTPTSEIISRDFGPASLGFLFGITYLCHQVGGFISTWLGGIFIGSMGDYTSVWLVDIALCAMASLVSFRIRPARD